MRVTTFAPAPAIAALVDKFSIVDADEEVTRVLLPERGLILGIRFAGAAHAVHGAGARLPDATLTGVQGTARSIRTEARSGILLAQFRPGGGAAWLRMPAHELFGSTVALDAVLDRTAVAQMHERVAAATTDVDRVAALQALLVDRVRDATLDRVAIAAMRRIEAGAARVRIAQLATELGISRDALEKRFRRAIGVSPKKMVMLVRVHRAIALARSGARMARVALDAGYFDQAHFNRDFRAVVGTSPMQFFGAATFC